MDGVGASLAISVQETGKELGRGAHSRIVEVLYSGLRCKAKKIDAVSRDTEKKVSEACALLARFRHPHLVQFLGTHKTPAAGGLAIVTEYLPCSLAWALERYGSLPEPLTHSILRDVSVALSYLHGLSPPAPHGHLVPDNVLLTADFTAKLSDVGVARSVGLLERLPRESLVYCPPEGGGIERDVYSFGAVMVHAIGGRHPASLADSKGSTLLSNLGVAERHPLSGLMKDCLNPDPKRRPAAAQVLSTVGLEMTKFPPITMESRLDSVARLKSGSQNHPLAVARKASVSPQRTMRGREVDQHMALAIENESLKLQVEELQVANRGLKSSLERQVKVVSARDHEMAAKLMAKDQEILTKQQEVAAKEALQVAAENNLAAKEATLQGLSQQLQTLQDYLASRAEVGKCDHTQWARAAQSGRVVGSAVGSVVELNEGNLMELGIVWFPL